MSRKVISVNPENTAAFCIDKVHELKYQVIQVLRLIDEARANNRLDSEKPQIFEKLDAILQSKEKLVLYLQKFEIENEFNTRRRVPQDYYRDTFEFEKNLFDQKLQNILKKLDFEILIVKFKRLGNGLKAFCFVWEALFQVFLYIEKPRSTASNERNQTLRVFDIVITSIKDKGGAKKPCPHVYETWNDSKKIKELREREIPEANSRNKIDAKIQGLKKVFDANFYQLVFEPETIFFQRISFFIRKVFFQQKPLFPLELEVLFLWYINGYKNLILNESVKCELCQNRMIFDSTRTGFLPCTIHKNGKFFHDKCFIEK